MIRMYFLNTFKIDRDLSLSGTHPKSNSYMQKKYNIQTYTYILYKM